MSDREQNESPIYRMAKDNLDAWLRDHPPVKLISGKCEMCNVPLSLRRPGVMVRTTKFGHYLSCPLCVVQLRAWEDGH